MIKKCFNDKKIEYKNKTENLVDKCKNVNKINNKIHVMFPYIENGGITKNKKRRDDNGGCNVFDE